MGEDIFCDNKGEPIAAQEQKISIDIGGKHIADFCQLCAGELRTVLGNNKTAITLARKKAAEPAAPVDPGQPAQAPAVETPAVENTANVPIADPITETNTDPAEQSAEEIAATPGVDPNA